MYATISKVWPAGLLLLATIGTHSVAEPRPAQPTAANTTEAVRSAVLRELAKPQHLILTERRVEQLPPVDLPPGDDGSFAEIPDLPNYKTHLDYLLSFHDWTKSESDAVLTLREPALKSIFPTDPLSVRIDAFSTHGEDLEETLNRLEKLTGVVLALDQMGKDPLPHLELTMQNTTLRSVVTELAKQGGYDCLSIVYFINDAVHPLKFAAHLQFRPTD